MEKSTSESLTLGIDIGTSSIKCALVCHSSEVVVARNAVEHRADVSSEKNSNTCREQSVEKLLVALDTCIKLLPNDSLKLVKDIVVCGQMHGCVLWSSKSIFTVENLAEEKLNVEFISPLITWEDKRCSSEFLNSLPKSKLPVASGFGCATLFWLQRHQPEIVDKYDSAGTVMDLVVSYLCRTTQVYISTQNACSWGFYDTESKEWEIEKLKSANFPVHLLPKIAAPGYIVGQLSESCCYFIHSNATVRVALGDMQCSILATRVQPLDAVLNIGTSAQLSVVAEQTRKDVILDDISSYPALHLLPYFNDCSLIVAAALTGGNVFAFMVKVLKNWLHDLGLEPPSDKYIYDRLSACGIRDRAVPKLTINPVIWGERHDPDQKASVVDILPDSLSLGNIYNSICSGLLLNIKSMMDGIFERYGVKKLVATGNALLQSKILQENIEEVFGVECVICEDSDAAVGAAMSVSGSRQ